MASYHVLPSEPKKFDYPYISAGLKTYGAKIKQLKDADYHTQNVLKEELEKIEANLEDIFRQPRIYLGDKARLSTLEKNFRELQEKYHKILKSLDRISFSSSSLSDFNLSDQFIKRESLEYVSAMQINEEISKEKRQQYHEIENAMIAVSEMFVDLEKIIEEQGEMIVRISRELEVAEKQTGKAATELEKASEHSEKLRKRKVLCLIVSGILLLILIGIAIRYYDDLKTLF